MLERQKTSKRKNASTVLQRGNDGRIQKFKRTCWGSLQVPLPELLTGISISSFPSLVGGSNCTKAFETANGYCETLVVAGIANSTDSLLTESDPVPFQQRQSHNLVIIVAASSTTAKDTLSLATSYTRSCSLAS
jgi:hypothetical protein